MGLWDKFKSGFSGTTEPAQQADASRFYDGSSELKPESHIVGKVPKEHSSETDSYIVANYNDGIACMVGYSYYEAIRCFENVIDAAKGSYLDTYELMGDCHLQMNLYDEALKYLSNALISSQDNNSKSRVYAHLAFCYQMLGAKEDAYKSLLNSVQFNKNTISVLYENIIDNLGWINATELKSANHLKIKNRVHENKIEKQANLNISNDPNELFELAQAFQKGTNGYNIDEEKSFEYYKISADKGHGRACFYTGIYYYYGVGMTVDLQQAIIYLNKSALLDINDSYPKLAEIYLNCYDDKASADDCWGKYIDSVLKDYNLKDEKEIRSCIDTLAFYIDNYLELVLTGVLPPENYKKVGKDNLKKLNKINKHLIRFYSELAGSSEDQDKRLLSKRIVDLLKENISNRSNNINSKSIPQNTPSDDEFLNSLSLSDNDNPLDEYFNTAETYYYGLGDELQDYKEALRYYSKAADLGSDEAMLKLGAMYRDAEGCEQDNEKSLEYLKEGAISGNINCYAEMAKLFLAIDHIENASKCWDKFFNNNDQKNKRDIAAYSVNYMILIRYYSVEYKHKNKLLSCKSEIVQRLDRMKDWKMASDGQSAVDDMDAFYDYLR